MTATNVAVIASLREYGMYVSVTTNNKAVLWNKFDEENTMLLHTALGADCNVIESPCI